MILSLLPWGISDRRDSSVREGTTRTCSALNHDHGNRWGSAGDNTVYDLSPLGVSHMVDKPIFAEWCAVGSDRPCHDLDSGKFSVRSGDWLAAAMMELRDREPRRLALPRGQTKTVL